MNCFFLPVIEDLHKVTYKVVFIKLKHGAKSNVHPMYALIGSPMIAPLLSIYLQESGPSAVGAGGPLIP